MAHYRDLLARIDALLRPTLGEGRVADYIPELAKVAPDQFGMAIATPDGEVETVGQAATPFSVQSISKLFALVLAIQTEGDDLWARVGREPSGAPFNALIQLDAEKGHPRNPFINAGALVVSDVLCSHYAVPENAVAQFLSRLDGRRLIHFDERVARSERDHCGRNAAMLHLMQSYGNIRNPVDQVLGAYCRQCAIEMTCEELARAVTFLACGGRDPRTGEQILPAAHAKRVNALMLTCGTYDAAGDFAFRIGLPVKSGVGGGIVAVMPNRCGVCVWSPALDRAGNSQAGARALELLTTHTGWTIF